MLEQYKALAGTLDGFGTNSPIYFRFEAPLATEWLPTPLESMSLQGDLILLDVDPNSPYQGQPHPVTWSTFDVTTGYLPENLLAVAPLAGWPLRPKTVYAMVVTTGLASTHDAFQERLHPEHEEHEGYAHLLREWTLAGRSPEEIAVATVFTTRDPLHEMGAIAHTIAHDLEMPELNQTLEHLESFDAYTAWRTHYPSPVFTFGERPYMTEGGEFRFREDGRPMIHSWDDLRVAVCTPSDLTSPPEGGWPTFIYQHGTGGNYRTYCNHEGALEVATRLGAAGFVGLGIDQPLHDTRNGGEVQSDLANFNFINPASVRTNFRQGAADALYLAEALSRRPVVFKTPDGTDVPLDPTRVLFVGHSQGGTTGAIAGPWLGRSTLGAFLSGAGGLLSTTIVDRKDILDFAELLHGWLDLAPDERVTVHHPTVGLLQLLVEETDPVNYAPYWFAEQGLWHDQAPLSVLMTSGTDDEASVYKTAIALATAAQLTPMKPTATALESLTLRGIQAAPSPFEDNLIGYDGRPTTGAFVQWDGGTHWVAFQSVDVSDLYTDYLTSLIQGNPRIEWRDP